eukprot:gnl/MRDRNA2_/MRDRNA2_84451_c0_seq9.p1 gnl/MRDRNA2_/MRDRNA2_84451_c0~~gnl/MRDRNA2_/MRDRNA2_84451_c0_seq9.p1  ORF type:complete len:129 (+),score=32.51 gnl/MRDRNA2_/MRDRNA2_84451_c0_seq9:85-471(+)
MCKIACAIILGLVGQNLALTQKSAQQPLAVQGAPQQQQPNPFAATPFAFPGFGAPAQQPAQQPGMPAAAPQQPAMPMFDFGKAMEDGRAELKKEQNTQIREAKAEIRKEALDIGRAVYGLIPAMPKFR